MPGLPPPAAGLARPWWVWWAAIAVAAAALATALDSVLLQLRRSFFTGGFLAADYVTGPAQAAAFLVTSFVSDLAVVGLAALAVIWACGHFRVDRMLAAGFAGALSLGPVVLSNAVSYQIVRHLGDIVELDVMFDLAGRDPGELLAVSSAHVARLAWLAGGVVVAAAAVAWIARARKGRGPAMPPMPARRALVLALGLLVAGTVTTVAARTQSDVLDNGLRRKPTGWLLETVINRATDFDRDGYGILGRPPDPDLFDARVYPYALEVPGSGIDENGVGGSLPADVEPYTEPPAQAGRWRSTPDVVLIVLESFRADAVGAVFDGRQVTPALDALAAGGVSVERAYSHNGYTVQSRRHLFTGSVADIQGETTLIDDFNANGYETAYFSGQDESFGGAAQGVGFERADVSYDARTDRDRRYTRFTTPGSLAVPHTVLNERVAEFLASRESDRPLFLYVNFHDTHFPYHHGDMHPIVSDAVVTERGMADRPEALRAMYLNAAANVDRAIGELLSNVRRSLGHEPGVIVLADHGESLFEEGFLGHGYALNDAQTRIPFIVSNLPIAIVEPFGQSELRGLLHEALSAPGASTPGPAVTRDPSKTVFQYVGTLRRAARIALVDGQERVKYDLRARRALVGGGAWRRDADLDSAEHERAMALIHLWERMLLARHAAGIGDE